MTGHWLGVCTGVGGQSLSGNAWFSLAAVKATNSQLNLWTRVKKHLTSEHITQQLRLQTNSLWTVTDHRIYFSLELFFASCELRYLTEEIVLSVRLQIRASDLVVGIWDVGAVSPLGQDDGLHVFPVQTATLWSVSRQLRGGEVVLVGGNIDCVNILLMSPNVNIYTQGLTPK